MSDDDVVVSVQLRDKPVVSVQLAELPAINTHTVPLKDTQTVQLRDDPVVSVQVADQAVITYTISGAQGPPGPPGPPGGEGLVIDDVSYSHVQGAAASIWLINHPLGFQPNVAVVDSTGEQVEGEVVYVDSDTIRVAFSAAFSGVAYLS